MPAPKLKWGQVNEKFYPIYFRKLNKFKVTFLTKRQLSLYIFIFTYKFTKYKFT